MIAKLNQANTTTFYNVSEQKATAPSTYRQRVIADRIVMLIMLIGTIAFAIISA